MSRFLPLLLLSASCAFAGDVIAVMKSPTTVYRLKGSSGAFIGQNQPSGGPLTDVQVSGGVMIVRSPHLARRYNARTGAFMGQSQF